MKEKKTLLTKEGLKDIQAELDELINVKRPANLKAIKEARALGDLSENADYDAAKNDQAELEGRIKVLEKMLENYEIIEKKATDKVGLGSTVTVNFVDDDEEEVYKIVGTTEVDVDNNMISKESPIGEALYGHKEGEVVTVNLPNGGGYEIKIAKIA